MKLREMLEMIDAQQEIQICMTEKKVKTPIEFEEIQSQILVRVNYKDEVPEEYLDCEMIPGCLADTLEETLRLCIIVDNRKLYLEDLLPFIGTCQEIALEIFSKSMLTLEPQNRYHYSIVDDIPNEYLGCELVKDSLSTTAYEELMIHIYEPQRCDVCKKAFGRHEKRYVLEEVTLCHVCAIEVAQEYDSDIQSMQDELAKIINPSDEK